MKTNVSTHLPPEVNSELYYSSLEIAPKNLDDLARYIFFTNNKSKIFSESPHTDVLTFALVKTTISGEPDDGYFINLTETPESRDRMYNWQNDIWLPNFFDTDYTVSTAMTLGEQTSFLNSALVCKYSSLINSRNRYLIELFNKEADLKDIMVFKLQISGVFQLVIMHYRSMSDGNFSAREYLNMRRFMMPIMAAINSARQ